MKVVVTDVYSGTICPRFQFGKTLTPYLLDTKIQTYDVFVVAKDTVTASRTETSPPNIRSLHAPAQKAR